jgi:aspartate kinase
MNIDVDMIIQNNTGADGTTDLYFTVHKNEMGKVLNRIALISKATLMREISGDDKSQSFSRGMVRVIDVGIASQMFRTLAEEAYQYSNDFQPAKSKSQRGIDENI